MLLILLIKKQYVSSDSRLGLARNTKHYFYNNLSEWATPEEEREKVRAVLSELRLRLFNLKEVINGRYEYYLISRIIQKGSGGKSTGLLRKVADVVPNRL